MDKTHKPVLGNAIDYIPFTCESFCQVKRVNPFFSDEIVFIKSNIEGSDGAVTQSFNDEFRFSVNYPESCPITHLFETNDTGGKISIQKFDSKTASFSLIPNFTEDEDVNALGLSVTVSTCIDGNEP